MAKTPTTAPRVDVYDRVTESIIAALEQARSPQEWPWVKAAQQGRPINFTSKRPYNGINWLILGLAVAGGASRYWGTFRQWQNAGAMVRKGEKGTGIIYYGDVWVDRDTGRKVEPNSPNSKKIIYPKSSTVFHAGQVDGWNGDTGNNTEADELAAAEGAERFEHVETFIAATKAAIIEKGAAAFYTPALDTITMPTRDRFRDTAAADATTHFYGTLLHELVHWTGHKSRCNRDFSGVFGNGAYAFEELIAEIGSAFLSADLGISPTPREDNVGYVAHWLKVLKDDKKKIVEASAASGRAATFLHSLQGDTAQADEADDEPADEIAEAA